MPIIIPSDLPAAAALRSEGHVVTSPRPDALRVALLNLMPDKVRTETQFARNLSRGERPVELVLAKLRTYQARHAQAHVERFYADIHRVLARGVDALIVTGAPVEILPFEAVAYWDELTDIFAQARHAVPHRLFICWAAQAALYERHGILKTGLPAKAFGVFDHRVVRPDIDLMHGMSLHVPVPVSRHTDTRITDLEAAGATLLAVSQETGPGLAQSGDGREVYSFNHFEYDPTALWDEYRRDLLNGISIARPRHYFRRDDPALGPDVRWEGAAARFFGNWLARVTRDRRSSRPAPRKGHGQPRAGQVAQIEACCLGPAP
jgi:homoserine O-succinyltransferase